MNKIAYELKEGARKLHACRKGYRGLESLDKEGLVRRYIENIDFAIRYDFPSPAYIKDHFEGIGQKFGIFTDDHISLANPRFIVANGHTSGIIKYGGFSVAEIHVRHQSDIYIEAKGNAIIFINTYNQCKVKVTALEKAKVRIFRYGGNICSSGDVKTVKSSFGE